jgi:hypothetical protein
MIYVDRGSGSRGAYDTKNNNVHDNVITHLGSGEDGLWVYHNAQTAAKWTNRWDSNIYYVADGVLPRWHFGRSNYDWRTLTGTTDFERHGTMIVLDKQQIKDPCQITELGLSGGMVIDSALLLGIASLAIRHRPS